MIGLLLSTALAQPLVDEVSGGSLTHTLEFAWKRASEGAQWRSPWARERSELREAVTELIRGAPGCDLERRDRARDRLAAVNLRLAVLADPGGSEVWVVSAASEPRGAGMVAIRCGEASDWVWQAPHSFFDLGTADIVRGIFAAGDARAAMWSTVHRYRALPDEDRSDVVHPADVTREYGSLFHAATVGLAVGDPDLTFVQLHGFGSGAFEGDGILSTGSAADPPEETASRLVSILGDIRVYGAGAATLGGTRNVQGRALREWPTRRFFHLELSRPVRERLETDPGLRIELEHAITGSPW